MAVAKMGKLYQAKGSIGGVRIGGYGDTHYEAIQNCIGDLCEFCGGTGKITLGQFDEIYDTNCFCQDKGSDY